MRRTLIYLTLSSILFLGEASWPALEHVAQVEDWLENGSGQALSSDELLDLVPLPEVPETPWAYDRFDPFTLIRQIFIHYVYGDSTQENDSSTDRISQLSDSASRLASVPDTNNMDPDTNFKLGQALFWGMLGPRNFTSAFDFYKAAADEGHAAAQFMVGLCYSTGVFGNLEINQAKATIYYTFAALAGDVRAQMAMGNRHYNGIAGAQNFDQAERFYHAAAKQAVEYLADLPSGIGQRQTPHNSFVIADETSFGIFGRLGGGNSLSVSPLRKFLLEYGTIEEGIAFLQESVEEDGSLESLSSLVKIYHYGVDFGKPDDITAVMYARECLDAASRDPPHYWMVMWANAFLGSRYMRGEGVDFDIEMAKAHFDEGIKAGYLYEKSKDETVDTEKMPYCAICQTGLGLINLWHSQDMDLPAENRSEHFEIAYRHFANGGRKGPKDGSVTSLFFLAKRKYDEGDMDSAVEMLEPLVDRSAFACFLLPRARAAQGSRHRTRFPPQHEVSADTAQRNAVELYRSAAEWAEELNSPLRFAQSRYQKDPSSSLLGFLISAEVGHKSAELNVADILDVKHSTFNIPWISSWPVPEFVKDREATALKYFIRASANFKDEALVKVGDYFYYGLGTNQSYEKALNCYSLVSRWSSMGIAQWSLGWMYQRGLGQPQDVHLAKRQFDETLRSSPPSLIAVKLSLLYLQLENLVGWFSRLRTSSPSGGGDL